MEYMTPSIYQKIIKTLSYIYSKSAVDEKIDLFRFKDVLDSFSEGQYKSKLWAVEELEKHITDAHNACLIIGGWYGFFSHILCDRGFKNQIKNIDLDPICKIIGKKLCLFDNISFETGDGLDIFFNEKRNAENKIVVCTACEHIDSEELYFYLSNKNKNMLVCLQSNNYYEVNSHVNCHDSLEEFIKSLPLKTILYSGTKRYKDDYDRFMVIGK